MHQGARARRYPLARVAIPPPGRQLILLCTAVLGNSRCIRVNSALTTSLVGHTKTAVQTIVGFFVLAQDVKATYAYVAGVTITSLGGLLFTLAKYHHSERLSGNLPSSFWAWCATWVGVSVSRGRNTLLKASKL